MGFVVNRLSQLRLNRPWMHGLCRSKQMTRVACLGYGFAADIGARDESFLSTETYG